MWICIQHKKLTLSTICVSNILLLSFFCGRAATLEHMTAANIYALHVAKSSSLPHPTPQAYITWLTHIKLHGLWIFLQHQSSHRLPNMSTSCNSCLCLFLVWLMLSSRVAILKHMTAAHMYALHWMWLSLQVSHIPLHKLIEHERLTDPCMECGYVYNTKANIVYHMCKHHVHSVITPG